MILESQKNAESTQNIIPQMQCTVFKTNDKKHPKFTPIAVILAPLSVTLPTLTTHLFSIRKVIILFCLSATE